MTGQDICVLVDQYKEQGIYDVEWNGKNKQGNRVSSGVYHYQIVANEYRKTLKMILLE